MRFRTKHVADAVVERIQAISEAIQEGRPVSPPVRVQIERNPDGSMRAMVKTLKDGTQERVEIGNDTDIPEGMVDVTPQDTEEPELPGLDESGLDTGTILGGGDAIDAALQS